MTAPADPDPIQQAAIDWFARLQGDATIEDWSAFQAWLEANPANAAAYDVVEALWVDLDDAAPTPAAGPAGLDNVVALPRRSKPPTRRLAWSGVAAAAAAVVAAVALAPRLIHPAFTDYATQRGEMRQVSLADGSRLTLGSATTLRVRLERDRRDVVLVDGEASFDVAHQANRPFVVAVAHRQVRVLGTEFNILSHADRLAVTVRRGLVSVSGGEDGEVRLARGQQLVSAKGLGAALVRPADPDAVFAWKSGKLVYRQTPLPEVVADLNRYVSVPIRVDPSAASVKISGVLLIDKEAAMIRRLELFAPIIGQAGPGEIVLKAKAARP